MLGPQYDNPPFPWYDLFWVTLTMCVGALACPFVPTSDHCDICKPHMLDNCTTQPPGLLKTHNTTPIKVLVMLSDASSVSGD